jgi:hypothetical protein
MKFLLLNVMFINVFIGSAFGEVAQPPNVIDQNIMIVIATATSGTGVSMLRLSFPSADACQTAAKILQEDIRGGYVTARCLKTH